MPDSALEDEILAYLRIDIAKHGGTARRLSKIQLHMATPHDDAEFSRAIESLRRSRVIAVEEIPGMGFIYARPL